MTKKLKALNKGNLLSAYAHYYWAVEGLSFNLLKVT